VCLRRFPWDPTSNEGGVIRLAVFPVSVVVEAQVKIKEALDLDGYFPQREFGRLAEHEYLQVISRRG